MSVKAHVHPWFLWTSGKNDEAAQKPPLVLCSGCDRSGLLSDSWWRGGVHCWVALPWKKPRWKMFHEGEVVECWGRALTAAEVKQHASWQVVEQWLAENWVWRHEWCPLSWRVRVLGEPQHFESVPLWHRGASNYGERAEQTQHHAFVLC